MKDLPAERLAYSGELVDLTQKVLNNGLRPHLTKWQAKYRKWYFENSNKEGSPQDIQKAFPEYEELLSDTLTTVDGTTMKMLVDRIHVRNDGIVVEFKCGVAIEQEYVK